MNERIKKLARQAGFHSSAIIDLGTGTGVEVWHKYDIENDQEDFPTDEMMTKFAELIVKECADLCEHESNDDEYDQFDMGQSVKAENIKIAIKQHFGVEE